MSQVTTCYNVPGTRYSTSKRVERFCFSTLFYYVHNVDEGAKKSRAFFFFGKALLVSRPDQSFRMHLAFRYWANLPVRGKKNGQRSKTTCTPAITNSGRKYGPRLMFISKSDVIEKIALLMYQVFVPCLAKYCCSTALGHDHGLSTWYRTLLADTKNIYPVHHN